MIQVDGNNDATCLCKVHVQLPIHGKRNTHVVQHLSATAKQPVQNDQAMENFRNYIIMECKHAPVKNEAARTRQDATKVAHQGLGKKRTSASFHTYIPVFKDDPQPSSFNMFTILSSASTQS